jgi:hypothetical protein
LASGLWGERVKSEACRPAGCCVEEGVSAALASDNAGISTVAVQTCREELPGQQTTDPTKPVKTVAIEEPEDEVVGVDVAGPSAERSHPTPNLRGCFVYSLGLQE